MTPSFFKNKRSRLIVSVLHLRWPIFTSTLVSSMQSNQANSRSIDMSLSQSGSVFSSFRFFWLSCSESPFFTASPFLRSVNGPVQIFMVTERNKLTEKMATEAFWIPCPNPVPVNILLIHPEHGLDFLYESSCKNRDHVPGDEIAARGLCYHFWTHTILRPNRYRRKDSTDPFAQVKNSHQQ